jgi:hypothetical protein
MSISRRSIAATVLGVVMVCEHALGESEGTPANAVEDFRKAMVARDHDAFSALCAAHLSYGHSGGKIQTREEFILDATSDNSKWKTLDFANVRNTVAGPNAISRFTLNGEVDSGGRIEPVSIGVLMVWQKQGDAWKLLARQGFKTEK